MQGVRQQVTGHKLGILLMGAGLVLLGILLAFFLLHQPAPDTPAPAAPGFRYFALMDGNCQEVRLAGREQDNLCGHALVHTLSTSGRAAFGLILANGHAISFSGTADEQVSPGQYQLIVDNVTLVDEKKAATRLDAQGQCIVTGDIGKSANIVCDATTKQSPGSYHFSFTSTRPADVVYGQ